MSIHSETVEILGPTEVEDPYSGEMTHSWDPAVVVATIDDAFVGYTSVMETTTPGRVQTVEQLRAILDTEVPILGHYRLRWRGNTYTVEGPALVRYLHGEQHHVTVQLKAVTG